MPQPHDDTGEIGVVVNVNGQTAKSSVQNPRSAKSVKVTITFQFDYDDEDDKNGGGGSRGHPVPPFQPLLPPKKGLIFIPPNGPWVAQAAITSEPPESAVASKFNITFQLGDGQLVTYCANVDVSLLAFQSIQDQPLHVSFSALADLTGNVAYSGLIGGGTVKITLDNGVIFSGVVNGGNEIVQSVSGSGEFEIS